MASNVPKTDRTNVTRDDAPESGDDVQHALAYLRERGPFLAMVLGAAVLVILVTAFVRHRSSRAELEAALQLAQAETVEEFEAVARNFSSTPPGAAALLGAAAEYFHAGDYGKAAEVYDQFLQKTPDHSMADLARLNRSACDEALERWEEARSGYASLLDANPGPHVTPQAALGLGRVLTAMGRETGARAVYEDVLLQHPDSDWNPQVEAALREVNRRIRQASNGSQPTPE